MAKRPRPKEQQPVERSPYGRLYDDLYRSALQYDMDSGALAALNNPGEAEAVSDEAIARDEPLLRIGLLSYALYGRHWPEVMERAFKQADKARYGEPRDYPLFSGSPASLQVQERLRLEMASRLIDPLTMRPVAAFADGAERFAQQVVDGSVQLEYHFSTKHEESQEML